MANAKTRTYMTKLHCQNCQTPFIIPRQVRHPRAPNHIKHMYCYICKETQPFIEEGEI